MKRYPKECIAFEILGDWCGIPRGTVAEGVAIAADAYRERNVGVRVEDEVLNPCAGYEHRTDDKIGGWWYPPHELRPLTAAARDFLDAAKAAQS